MRFVTLPGTDHLLMLEDPDTFHKWVLDFMGSVAGSPKPQVSDINQAAPFPRSPALWHADNVVT